MVEKATTFPAFMAALHAPFGLYEREMCLHTGTEVKHIVYLCNNDTESFLATVNGRST